MIHIIHITVYITSIRANLTESAWKLSKRQRLFALSVNSNSIFCYLYIANSGNYLLLSILVHYKTVRNNNVLSVNYHFNSNY